MKKYVITRILNNPISSIGGALLIGFGVYLSIRERNLELGGMAITTGTILLNSKAG